jgi:glycosyltransferase involved in cell wall biosynthesis
LHLAALVEHTEHVCCRYRLTAFRDRLAAAGHTLDVRPLPPSWAGRLRLGVGLRAADAVVLQRRLLPRWQLVLLRRRVRRLIFDLDDAVWLRDSYSPKGLRSPSRLRRFAAVARAADLVVAGNPFLAAESARWAGVGRVAVVPTCVDPARYPAAEHRRAGAGVQLVWVGSSSTLQGLERCRPHLEAVGRANPGLELKLVSDRFLRLGLLKVRECLWTEAKEAGVIASADVGIAWVPDDDWSRGKCGLKVLQYMAAGLPVVANPVGVHADFVRHGESGFLATTPTEWAAAVRALAADPELRRRMGAAGRRRVEAGFSVAAGAAAWADLLGRLGTSRGAA